MEQEYFQIPAVSNSTLTQFKYEISGQQKPDLTEAFFFGSLVDAMLTEPHRVSMIAKTYDGCNVNPELFRKAKKCYEAVRDDINAWAFIRNAEKQKVTVRPRTFYWNDIEFTFVCKCKWDFFGFISGDIKTIAATSQKQFEDACIRLDYYRARAWYMDLEHTDRDIIIGVSKVNYKVFFVRIERGDEKYNLGRGQYEDLIFKYWALKKLA